MIEFGLTDDQEALQRSAREFLAAECPPARVRDVAKDGDGVPRDLYKQMADLGWMSLLVPEKLGGLGLGALELALVSEEIGRVAAPGPFLSTQLVIAALVAGGTKAQQQSLLPRLMSGDAFATLAYLEDSDSDEPDGVQCAAKKTKDGWTLNGAKSFVLEAPGADVWLVAARTKAGKNGAGVSLFLVERGQKGATLAPIESLDLTHRFAELRLKNVAMPKTALVGSEHQGWALLSRLLDLACVGIAADSVGGAAKTLQMAVEYAHVREQFGRKIGSFQAVKHIAAEMAADVEPSRSLVWYAAWAWDHRPKEAARMAAMAKASLGDIYSRTARRSVEIHGGIGFTWEFDLQLWFKRAHVAETLFGDPTFHRERVAVLSGW